MVISIIAPTRKRPDNVKRLIDSATLTAENQQNIEFCFYVDNDDSLNVSDDRVRVYRGDRIILSEMWNKAYTLSSGDICMHGGDDIVFRTKGWDKMVIDAFNEVRDKILLVHGDDGHFGDSFGTHCFLHRNWVNTVGYFIPPYFSSDYNDTWLNEVENAIGRRKYLQFITEHMHWTFNKGPLDETHKERIERHKRDHVEDIYRQTEGKRREGVENLQQFINSFTKV